MFDMTLNNNSILITTGGYNNTNSLLFKIDLSGNLIWSRLYDRNLTCGNSFYPNKNIFAGTANTSSNQPMVAIFDNNGNLIVNKKYICDSTEWIFIWGVTNYHNSGYLICGVHNPLPSVGGNFNPVIMAIDSSGNFLWAKTYHTPAIVGETWTIKPTSDGGFILPYEPEHIGIHYGSRMGLFKIDGLGNPLWCRIYNIDDYDFPRNRTLITTIDNGFALGGIIRFNNLNPSRSFLVKTNSSGIVGDSVADNGICNIDTTLFMTTTPLTFTDSVFGQTNSSLTLQNYTPQTSIFTPNDSTFCMDSIQIFHTVVTTNEFNNNIYIYPNPFSSLTTISFGEEQKRTTIKIIDELGREIKIIQFTGKQLTIEKGEMSNGIYFVQIIDEKKNITNKKIIIQ